MVTITIPKKLADKGDLVLVSRAEYEELRMRPQIKTTKPTKGELRALARAERNYKVGKSLTLNDLNKRMAAFYRRKR